MFAFFSSSSYVSASTKNSFRGHPSQTQPLKICQYVFICVVCCYCQNLLQYGPLSIYRSGLTNARAAEDHCLFLFDVEFIIFSSFSILNSFIIFVAFVCTLLQPHFSLYSTSSSIVNECYSYIIVQKDAPW